MKRIVTCLLAAMLLSLAGCTGSFEPPFNFDPPEEAPAGSEAQPDPERTEGPDESDAVVTPDDEGYAIGYLGETLRTQFFDIRVDEAYTCYEFDGVTPEAGQKLLVAEVTLYNYTNYTQPMFNTDFEIWWDPQEGETSEDAWAFPLYGERGLEDGSTERYNLSEQQLPIEWEFPIREERTGILLYQVPESSSTFSVAFLEYYSDGSTGDLYEIRFSAPLAE